MEKLEFTSIRRGNSILQGFGVTTPNQELVKGKKSDDKEDDFKEDETKDEESEDDASSEEETDNEDENEESEDETNEDESEDEDDNSPTDEELELLQIIAKHLAGGDEEITEKELKEGDPPHDGATAELIASLEKKGLITCENGDVTEITEEGQGFISNEDDNDETNGNESDKNEETDEETSTENSSDHDEESGDAPEMNDEEENNEAPDDENNSGEDNSDKTEDGNPVMDEQELRAHAKNTSTEDLKQFLGSSKDELQTKIATEELATREAGGGQNNAQPVPGSPESQATPPVPGEEGKVDPLDFKNPVAGEENKKKFDEWVQNYLEDHDREDFEAMITKLILNDPKETKVLKQHYREDFSASSRVGNKVERVDNKEFQKWLGDYLAHQPYDHLKLYAIRLLKADPGAMNDIKNKYKSKLSLDDE